MTSRLEPQRIDAQLASVLPEGALFAVGGRVRDEVRSALDGTPRPAKDLDYVAVGLGLDELVTRLSALGRANVVGASFAVVKVAVDEAIVDVALPRRERSTGAAHRDFDVEWGPDIPLADDLARRDFRMNMLARAIGAQELVDPYGGAADIAARRIDILCEAAFREDPLRMLRACQFAARFEYEVSPRTFAAMRAAAPLVRSVSAERVHEELVKLLATAQRPSLGLELMRETGILADVLPELAEGVGVKQNAFHAYDVYRHGLATVDATSPGDLVLRLAALLHDVGKPRSKDGPHFYGHEIVGADMAAGLMGRLRFSHAEVETVAGLVRHHMYATEPEMTDGAVRRFVRRVGEPNLGRQFALRYADIAGSGLPKRGDGNERFEARVRNLLDAFPPLATNDLAIDGHEIVAAAIRHGRLPVGSRGGAIVGQILHMLLDAVLENPELNQRDTLRALTEQRLSEST